MLGGADKFLDLFVSSQSQTLSVFHRAHITQRCLYPFRIIPCDVIIDNLNERFNCYSDKAPPQFTENNTMEKNKIKEKILFSIVSALPMVLSNSIKRVP